jgi:hypothetical protein
MAMRLLKRHRVGLDLLGLVLQFAPRDLDIKLTYTADIVAAEQGDMA